MRQMSSSTPHLLESRDLDAVAAAGGPVPVARVQRPSYDSDSPYVDSPSGGKLAAIYPGQSINQSSNLFQQKGDFS